MTDRVAYVQVVSTIPGDLWVSVEIGPWDPDRHQGQGGFAFARTVSAEIRRYAEEGTVAMVSGPGGIGTHDVLVAVERAETYRIAAEVAAAVAADLRDVDAPTPAIRERVAALVETRFGLLPPPTEKVEP